MKRLADIEARLDAVRLKTPNEQTAVVEMDPADVIWLLDVAHSALDPTPKPTEDEFTRKSLITQAGEQIERAWEHARRGNGGTSTEDDGA